jgi:hypothetical protein
MAAISGEKVKDAEPTQEAAPAPLATPAAQEPPKPTDETQEEEITRNFRFHTEDATMSAFLKLLKAEPGVNPVEAWKRAGGKMPDAAEGATPETKAEPQEPSAPAQPEPSGKVAELTAKLAGLKAARKEARAAYEYGQADDIQDQIDDAQRALTRAEFDAERDAVAESAYTTQLNAARAKVIAEFPSVNDPNSPLHQEMVRENAFLAQTNPGFFDSPEFPLELVKSVKARRPDLFAQAPKTGEPPKPAPKVVQPVLKDPVGGVVPGDAGAAPLDRTAALSAIDSLSPEQLDALITHMASGKS